MQRKRVIIHAVLPKTGTTSIQHMLSDAVDALAEQDTAAIVRDERTAKLRATGLKLRPDLGLKQQRKYYRAAREFWNHVKTLQATNVIVSDENILGINSGNMFRPGTDRCARIAMRLIAFSKPIRFDLTVVLYTRDPEKLHLSAWNQIRKRSVVPDYREWASENPDIHLANSIALGLRTGFRRKVVTFEMEHELSKGRFLGQGLYELANLSAIPAPLKEYKENVSANYQYQGPSQQLSGRVWRA